MITPATPAEARCITTEILDQAAVLLQVAETAPAADMGFLARFTARLDADVVALASHVFGTADAAQIEYRYTQARYAA